jgi:hypothetical protein
MGLLGGRARNWRFPPDRLTSEPSDSPVTGPAAGHAEEPAIGRAGFTERVLITLYGIRQPIVAILLVISFMTVISGKPVDGLLLFVVATALAMDAGAREENAAMQTAWRLREDRLPGRMLVPGVAAAVVYSLTVGSFDRYSWPATAGVVGVGASVVVIGWGGPVRSRDIPPKFSRPSVLTWASLLVIAGLWELAALLGQPNIETGSYAHPTISTLTDPLLASTLGRAVALLGWIGLGFFLVER